MCTSLMLVQLRSTCQGISREILGRTFGKYKLSAKMMGLRASVAETDVVVVWIGMVWIGGLARMAAVPFCPGFLSGAGIALIALMCFWVSGGWLTSSSVNVAYSGDWVAVRMFCHSEVGCRCRRCGVGTFLS